MDRVICRCGHARDAHEHFREGSECALCPPGDCPRFRPARWWHRRKATPPQAGDAAAAEASG